MLLRWVPQACASLHHPPGQMHGTAITIFHPKTISLRGHRLCCRLLRYLGEEGKTLGALKITHNCLRM